MKFITIDGELLKNDCLTPTDKFLIQIINNLDKAGKAMWGSPDYYARELGLQAEHIRRRLQILEDYKLIWKNDKGYVLNASFEMITVFSVAKPKK